MRRKNWGHTKTFSKTFFRQTDFRFVSAIGESAIARPLTGSISWFCLGLAPVHPVSFAIERLGLRECLVTLRRPVCDS